MEAVKKYLMSKPSTLLLFVLVSFGLFVPFASTHAFFHSHIFDLADVLLALPFYGFILTGKLLMSIAVMVLGFVPAYLSSLILGIVLSDKLIILPYTSGGIVDIGWNITRDLANLAFIAILIVIAVRTMLQGKGIELLPKLIGIALIVNFTKVIAGVVVDIANILTNYFLAPVADFGSLALVNLFGKETPFFQFIGGISSLFTGATGDMAGVGQVLTNLTQIFSWSGFISDIIGSVAVIAVGWILAFTFFVFAAIFFVRYIVIWILVIFAPLAFAAMILPETAKYAKQWWSALTKWAFMGLGPAFILFLTAKIIEKKNDLFGDYQNQIFQETGFFQQLFRPFYTILNELLFWVVIIIFMWIGLTLTLKMNTQVSKLMVKGGRFMVGVAARGLTRRFGGAIQDVGTKMAKSGLAGTKIPLVGGWMRGAASQVEGFGRRTVEKQTEDAKKEAAKHGGAFNRAQMWKETNSAQFAGLLAVEAERDPDALARDLKTGTPEEQKAKKDHALNMLKGAKRAGREDLILPYFPESAGEIGRERELNLPQSADLRQKVLDGTLDKKQAMTQAYVREIKEKDKDKILSLESPDVIQGLDDSKYIHGAQDAATTPGKMASLKRGLEEMNYQKALSNLKAGLLPWEKEKLAREQAYAMHLGDLTERVLLKRGKGIENISKQMLEELIPSIAKRADDIDLSILRRIETTHGPEYVDKIFNSMETDELKKFKGKRPILNLMPEKARMQAENPQEYYAPSEKPRPYSAPVAPSYVPPPGPSSPHLEQLRRDIAQLERSIVQLPRALGDVMKKGGERMIASPLQAILRDIRRRGRGGTHGGSTPPAGTP